jgi:putative transposase
VGGLKVRLHRPLRGTAKAITVRREGRRWWVTIRCADVPAQPLPATGREVGIDLGVRVLVATSDGALITNDRHAERGAQRLARAQQSLATKQRGSRSRRRTVECVAAAHRRVRNRRADTLHQLSRRMVNDHDVIVHEKLIVSNLVRRPQPRPDGAGGYARNGAAAKSGLNRRIHDAGWGNLLAMIAYKAESAGRTVIAVDPRNTSRTCAHCGHRSAGNRRGAVFECQACGRLAHADTNAAINILRAGRAQQLNAA